MGRVKVEKKIVPNKCIIDNHVYKITRLNPEFIIETFDVIYDKRNKIKSVLLQNRHPNCNPNTNEFCIPTSFKGLDFNDHGLIFISRLLECFNLDHSYNTPWSDFDYNQSPCGFSVKLGESNG